MSEPINIEEEVKTLAHQFDVELNNDEAEQVVEEDQQPDEQQAPVEVENELESLRKKYEALLAVKVKYDKIIQCFVQFDVELNLFAGLLFFLFFLDYFFLCKKYGW